MVYSETFSRTHCSLQTTEDSMDLVSVNARTPWRSVVHVRIPRQCSRIAVLIAGFGQPMESWKFMQDDVLDRMSDGMVVLGRRGESQSRYVGLMSLEEQIAEAEASLMWLINCYLHGAPIVLVGHSVGGLIARELAARHHEHIHGLVQIAPVPVQRFALLKHWSFWRHGGMLAALTALGGVLHRRGFTPPNATLKGLFTGEISEHAFYEYKGLLVPDSVRVFVELMIRYDGTTSWNTVKEKIQGPNSIIIAPEDTTIPREALESMGGGVSVRTLCEGTPHCIQFAGELERKYNGEVIRKALQDKPSPKKT